MAEQELATAEQDSGELPLSKEEILQDYRLAYQSRQASLMGRREVMSGKAKFGIFGDGKEIPQIAMARVFEPGDFRAGYYRDQTLMLALGELSLTAFFAQLYAHADVQAEPATAGRAMNAHFATRSLNPDGSWRDLTRIHNSSADVSPTGSQMPRLVGLGYASRLFRHLEELQAYPELSRHGSEIAYGTIGNASTSEGMFWEAINAIGVLKAPVILSIYDDGYGISVTNEHQMVKQDISELLSGFQRHPDSNDGYDLYRVRAWDYPALLQVYRTAAANARKDHIPAIIHLVEVTQPQGHSTSGSHERYKSKERLTWEEEFDCVNRMRQWIETLSIASSETLDQYEREERKLVDEARRAAWQAYIVPIQRERRQTMELIDRLLDQSSHRVELEKVKTDLQNASMPLRRDISAAAHRALSLVRFENFPEKQALINWKKSFEEEQEERYSSHLYSQSEHSALKMAEIPAAYTEQPPLIYGFEVLNACFDAALRRDPRVIAFGEDVGRLGDVNQGFRGLQEKYGELRVSDTGIRETTILGQAIGMAMRGLRPIAEIQYLDYLLYALQIMSDDLATLHWRTKGGQSAPVIVRTRGHRLEGIWHSGSLMAGIIHMLRGMHVLVPRNMTQAAGFYNTLLKSDEPAIVVEALNGYRLREYLPENIGEFTVPVGVPQIIRPGEDLTVVTYGACCRIALDAAEHLSEAGIQAEVVDVQSLLPFDVRGAILESLEKTSRILFVDEDVPGGTTAYMLQQVIETQGGFHWLDSPPRTLPGKPHRPAYGSDGDYWSKPNAQTIFQAAYEIMHEADPTAYPLYDSLTEEKWQ